MKILALDSALSACSVAVLADGAVRAVRRQAMARGQPEALLPMVRGTGVGSVVGPLPGAGPTIASLIGYAIEKRISRTPHRFGKGAIEGISSPEAANNAAVQTAFVPTLSLGIPGTPTMAIMIGALMIHGIVPGPMLMSNEPQLFWGLVASFWIGNVLLLVINIPLIGLWVSFLNVPYRLLYPAIIILICVGSYSLKNSTFDVLVMLVVGVAAYGLRRHGFLPAPLLIGFVLSPMLEENFRRAMIMGRGDVTYLFDSPISIVTWLLTLGMVLSVLYRHQLKRLAARSLGDTTKTENR